MYNRVIFNTPKSHPPDHARNSLFFQLKGLLIKGVSSEFQNFWRIKKIKIPCFEDNFSRRSCASRHYFNSKIYFPNDGGEAWLVEMDQKWTSFSPQNGMFHILLLGTKFSRKKTGGVRLSNNTRTNTRRYLLFARDFFFLHMIIRIELPPFCSKHFNRIL